MKSTNLSIIKYGIFLGIIFSAIIYLIADSQPAGIAAGILVPITYYIIKKYYPVWQTMKMESRIEAELPAFLNSIAQELSLGMQFDIALKNSAEQSKGLLKKELNEIRRRIDSGKGIIETLQNSCSKFKSSQIKRTFSYLIYIYEQGNKKPEDIEPLKNLEKEFLIKQRNEIKKFNTKLSVLSLFVIIFSTIIPAIFQTFVIIGSSFIELNLSNEHIFWIIVLLFPTANVIILIWINEITPAVLRWQKF